MSNEQTVFGIDLGTTFSCIAYVDEYGRPTVLKNFEGDLTTPSVVELGSTVVVGEEAVKHAVLRPDAVVSMVKREMGKAGWRFSFEGQDYTAEQIAAFILKKVVSDAQIEVGHDIKRVVITCPAYFGVNEREATAIAGRIAGLDVLAVINEPTAAAISYAMQKADDAMSDQVALVYDLGGGTFDITMIAIKKGAIIPIVTGGDHQLGGHDWDAIVVQYLAQEWMHETGNYDDPTGSLETLQDLWVQAESAKRALSAHTETVVRVTYHGQAAAITLSREKFNELTAPLLNRTIDLTRQTLADAKDKGYTHFDQLLLVGGSTKMPQVTERLKQEFPTEPRRFDPDQAVAKGAALYGLKLDLGQKIEELESQGMSEAQATAKVAERTGYRPQLVGTINNTTVGAIISHSFGVVALNAARNEIIANLVIRQSALPATATDTFGTAVANMSHADLRIMENDHNEAEVEPSEGKLLGSAELSLPPGLPQNSPIQVTFEINDQGRLEMTAIEQTTGRSVKAVIETKAVMSEEDIVKSQQLVRMTPLG